MIIEVLSTKYDHVGATIVNSLADLERLVATAPDFVVLGMKQVYGADSEVPIWVADYLDLHDIAYGGSPGAAISLDFYKDKAKSAVRAAGLPTAESFLAVPGEYSKASLPLNFPLFVKPLHAGGGKGVDEDSVVRDFAAFTRKVTAIEREFHSPALVESYLTGREFSVAVLETASAASPIAMPIEIVANANERGDRILSLRVKHDDTERVIAVHDATLRAELQELAIAVFRALGARDYGRIDFRMDAASKLHFLEVNLVPGILENAL
jgi:D-alanine-D-alanine ligase